MTTFFRTLTAGLLMLAALVAPRITSPSATSPSAEVAVSWNSAAPTTPQPDVSWNS